jgi:hypothetical protein
MVILFYWQNGVGGFPLQANRMVMLLVPCLSVKNDLADRHLANKMYEIAKILVFSRSTSRSSVF